MSPFDHIRAVDYTVIRARDLPAMRTFYEGVLRFKVARELSPRWIEYNFGAQTLALCDHRAMAADAPTPPGAASLQLAFRVPPGAVADCAAALTAAGIALERPVTDQPFGHRTVFFRDPDGNILEIYAEI
ncbi:VOC family protein [Pseudooceanicola sp. LIPI14-2-Ac024]|uniref:VOC family protein n=1 Tax=Pseudooceanicola sp. LIPI14-2-Ac024 TaxID=3344875 RepID=UPI0035D065CB